MLGEVTPHGQEEVDLLADRELTIVDENLAVICRALYGDRVAVEFNVIDGTHIVKWDVDGVDQPEDLEAFVLEHIENVSEQAAAANVRAERNKLLRDCDWTHLMDIPKATQTAYKDYRQALRDITKQEGFPDVVDWPVRPA